MREQDIARPTPGTQRLPKGVRREARVHQMHESAVVDLAKRPDVDRRRAGREGDVDKVRHQRDRRLGVRYLVGGKGERLAGLDPDLGSPTAPPYLGECGTLSVGAADSPAVIDRRLSHVGREIDDVDVPRIDDALKSLKCHAGMGLALMGVTRRRL